MKRIVISILLVIFVVLCLTSCGTPTSYTEKPIEDSTEIKETIQPEQKESENIAIETDNVASNMDNIYEENNIPPELTSGTIGEKNALKKALSYLRFTAFSYTGLIEQLEFEGFTHEEAVYGADNCGADWNEQAFLKAKSYLDFSSFSREGLIEQLEFEGFTHEEAIYGVDNCGADWNEQAVKKAESYLEIFSFSRERLVDQLEYEGFTHEQAVYGAEAVGY
mgnify:FL=1